MDSDYISGRYSLTFIVEVDVNTNGVPINSMRTSGDETVIDYCE
jgi:hypothetical protein